MSPWKGSPPPFLETSGTIKGLLLPLIVKNNSFVLVGKGGGFCRFAILPVPSVSTERVPLAWICFGRSVLDFSL